MAYWRQAGRKVKWTREGKLVYVKETKNDPIYVALMASLSRLIRQPLVDGVTTDELVVLCRALNLRQQELNTLELTDKKAGSLQKNCRLR